MGWFDSWKTRRERKHRFRSLGFWLKWRVFLNRCSYCAKYLFEIHERVKKFVPPGIPDLNLEEDREVGLVCLNCGMMFKDDHGNTVAMSMTADQFLAPYEAELETFPSIDRELKGLVTRKLSLQLELLEILNKERSLEEARARLELETGTPYRGLPAKGTRTNS